MRWPWSRDDDDIDVQSFVDGLDRLSAWDLGAPLEPGARAETPTRETDPLLGRITSGLDVGVTGALLQARPDADIWIEDLTISPPQATVSRPVATPFEDPGGDEGARRKHQALQRVQTVVGDVDLPRRRDGFVELADSRRLVMVYGRLRERAHGESGFSVSLPNRLPEADFLVLLLGEDDLVIPAKRLVEYSDQASGSGNRRPPFILGRTVTGEFYARFGCNGPRISLDKYVGRYDSLAAGDRGVAAHG